MQEMKKELERMKMVEAEREQKLEEMSTKLEEEMKKRSQQPVLRQKIVSVYQDHSKLSNIL